jgi:mitogen-activated protein kinase organizer 1
MKEDNKHLKVEMVGHKSCVYVTKFSKDGEHIMSGSQDKSIKLWNPYKGLMIKSYDMHSHDVLDLAILQDNTKFASVGMDKQVYFTDSIKGNVIRRFYGHTDRINTIAINKNEEVLVSGSYDCSVRIWDLKSQNKDAVQTLSHAKDSITKVIVLRDKIVSASVDGKIRLYDIRMGQMLCDNFEFAINSFDISPDENFCIISGLDNGIRLYDMNNGEIINIYKDLHKCKTYPGTVKYSNTLEGFFATSENNDVIYYDILGKNNKIFKGHSKVSCGLDTHPFKNNLFVTSGFDAKIILWDTDN